MATFGGESYCDCAICSKSKGFSVPDEVLEELLQGRVSIFAGAGISTESRDVHKETFLERCAAEIGVKPSLGFPEVMSKYSARPNGRLKLLHAIKERFEHIDSFPEMRRQASTFHRELGTLTPVRNVITTNWDMYFEKYCMATPFVADPDVAFWEAADRRVLKLHGSIANFGSIVATAEDYDECARRLDRGVIGGLLKTILATQTVIFIGYSLRDSDFRLLYEFVKKEMSSLHRQSYVVTPFEKDAEEFKKDGFAPIVTDGTFFVRQVKRHAVNQGVLLDDELYESASELLWQMHQLHEELYDSLEPSKFPEVLYAGAYQDGVMHALERCIAMRGSGEYSRPQAVPARLRAYDLWRKEKLRRGVYEDVAYIEGYMNGLLYLAIEPRERAKVPKYFAFGSDCEFQSLRQLKRFLRTHPDAHKRATKRARQCYASKSNPDEVIIHHPPWL